MGDLNPKPTPQADDPVTAYRKMYNPQTSTDADIYTHLSEPNNYRAAFGTKQSSDDDIRTHMQKFGMSRPDLTQRTDASGIKPNLPPSSVPAIIPKTTNEATGEGPVAAGVTSFESQLSKMPRGMLKSFTKPFTPSGVREMTAEADKDPWEQVKDVGKNLNPIARTSNRPDSDIDYGATAANILPFVLGAKKGFKGKSSAVVDPAEALTSAIGKTPKVNTYAKSQGAVSSLQAAGDAMGVRPEHFQGIKGVQLGGQILDKAMETHEANFNSVLDHARFEPVPVEHLQHYAPDLLNHISEIKGGLNSPITLDDINSARIEANKAPGMGQAMQRPDTLKPSVSQPIKNWKNIGDQARRVLYPAVQETTGIDVSPIKQMESDLLGIKDPLNKARNVISQAEAESQMNKQLGIRQPLDVPMSKTGVAGKIMGRMVEKVFPPDSPAEIFNKKMRAVFSGPRASNPLNMPGVNFPVGKQTPNASGLGRVKNGSIPPPEAVLGGKGGPTPGSDALSRGVSQVPEPIGKALAQGKPTQPTGEGLLDTPFSYPYQAGEELGGNYGQPHSTAGEVQAMHKFFKENPSGLGRIPVKIAKATAAKKGAPVQASTTATPQMDPNLVKLIERMRQLEKEQK